MRRKLNSFPWLIGTRCVLDISSARLEWCSRRQSRIQIPSFKKYFADKGAPISLRQESYSGEYADLIETITTSELILAVEWDLWPSGYEGSAIANLDDEEVIWLFNLYREFYEVQKESIDRVFGLMTQLKVLTVGDNAPDGESKKNQSGLKELSPITLSRFWRNCYQHRLITTIANRRTFSKWIFLM